ncbi:MAG: transcription elongation factor Spt5 [DPANN group archaeon]|nr:transcription elongation factor Spt5 [DPANN group archaeon]
MILTVRTTVGREKTAIDSIDLKKTDEGIIQAIISPAEIKGYFFVEGENQEEMEAFIKTIPHIRGVISKEVSVETLNTYFEERTVEITIKEGDFVEVMGGPFKREKAKITRINEQKREAKIELIEAVVPIPITIKIDLLKKISN